MVRAADEDDYDKMAEGGDDDNQEAPKPCCSNRVTAIVFMNLYCFTQVFYLSLAKMCTNAEVNVIDLCFVRTFINFLTAIFTVTISK